MTEHEKINRFVFPQCESGVHVTCPCWQPGYVDGEMRSAGEQCSCLCHKSLADFETLTGAGVFDQERELKG